MEINTPINNPNNFKAGEPIDPSEKSEDNNQKHPATIPPPKNVRNDKQRKIARKFQKLPVNTILPLCINPPIIYVYWYDTQLPLTTSIYVVNISLARNGFALAPRI